MTAKHCKPVALRLAFGGLLSLALGVCGLLDNRVEGVQPAQAKLGAQEESVRNWVIAGVCSDEDGKPLSGVRVVLYREDHEQQTAERLADQTTADDGRFRFTGLARPPADFVRMSRAYGLVLTKAGRGSIVTSLRQATQDSLQFNFRPAATLQGRVTDASGKPLTGVRVWARSLFTGPVDEAGSARTDADGRYAIKDMTAIGEDARRPMPEGKGMMKSWGGSYFDVVHPDYGHERPMYRSMPATVDVILRPAGIVEGRVFDHVTVRPAAGVLVSMQGTNREGPQGGGWGRTRTDATGKYRFQSVAAGKYNIWADAADRTCAALDSFAVEAGKQHAAPNLGLIEGGWIEGRVIDAAAGSPISGRTDRGQVKVGIYGPARPRSGAAVQSVDVDTDGRFRMRVAPGLNFPYIMTPGYFQTIENQDLLQTGVEVKAGETTTVGFRVRPAVRP